MLYYRLNYWIEPCILAVAFFLPLSLTVTTAFLALGTGLWMGRIILARRLDFRATPFDLLVALYVALSAASIWNSPDRDFSFYNYYHLMGRYILLYYFIINNVHSLGQVKRLVRVLLCSAAVVAAYGFYQYVYGMNISALQWVDGEQFPGLTVRVFSTLKNPNILASFLVTITALCAGLGFNTYRLKEKLVFFSLILAFGVCLAFTYSRGAWLSVLAVLVTFGLLYNRKLLWLLAIIPVASVVCHDVFIERLLSILNPTDTSATLRLALWESTLAMIADKPLLGIGWGAYWLVYPKYDFFVNNSAIKIFHAHNMYLNIAAEIGIPGMLVFGTLLWGHVRRAYVLATTAADRWTRGLMLGVLAALVGIFVGGFTDYDLFNIQMSMLFWLLNAIIVVCLQTEAKSD